MKSIVGKIALSAALLVVPLSIFAQNVASQPGTVSRGVERTTLLTGPHVLSPPHGKPATRTPDSPFAAAIFAPTVETPAAASAPGSFRFVPTTAKSPAKSGAAPASVPGKIGPGDSKPSPASLRFDATVPPAPIGLTPPKEGQRN